MAGQNTIPILLDIKYDRRALGKKNKKGFTLFTWIDLNLGFGGD